MTTAERLNEVYKAIDLYGYRDAVDNDEEGVEAMDYAIKNKPEEVIEQLLDWIEDLMD